VTITMEDTGIESGTTVAGTEILLTVLHDALSACEEADLDLLSARTAAGSALISLSALARATAATLGVDPGTWLADGPGVVVVRDLAAATRLLARAASRATMNEISGANIRDLVATAEALHTELLDAMQAAA
jgi:hypothetical protein